MKANEMQIGGRHYKTSYEHWDLCIKIPLGYLEGCATKYVARWRKKHGIEDLKKAQHYLAKLMENLNFPVSRNLGIADISIEVLHFTQANKIEFREKEFIHILSTYENPFDLEEAAYILYELIEYAEKELSLEVSEELNRPGTPDNGGHHEI